MSPSRSKLYTRVEFHDNHVMVLRARRRTIPIIQEWCDDNGYRMTDARSRRTYAGLTLVCVAAFAANGHWIWLIAALVYGSWWKSTFPGRSGDE